MPWETRRNKGRYYTRSTRVDGKLVREYFGSGEAADLAAQLDETERLRRKMSYEQIRLQQAHLDDIDHLVDLVCRETNEILKRTLEAAGCYRHRRGEWRKPRERDKQTKSN